MFEKVRCNNCHGCDTINLPDDEDDKNKFNYHKPNYTNKCHDSIQAYKKRILITICLSSLHSFSTLNKFTSCRYEMFGIQIKN